MRSLTGITLFSLLACAPKEPQIPEVTVSDITISRYQEEEEKPEPKKPKKTEDYKSFQIEPCKVPRLTKGTFYYSTGKWSATYEASTSIIQANPSPVQYKRCRLVLFSKTNQISFEDDDCDNMVDTVYLHFQEKKSPRRFNLSLERSDLDEKLKKRFDGYLQEARQYSCPENQNKFEKYMLQNLLDQIDTK